jgi:hypothetical protein
LISDVGGGNWEGNGKEPEEIRMRHVRYINSLALLKINARKIRQGLGGFCTVLGGGGGDKEHL